MHAKLCSELSPPNRLSSFSALYARQPAADIFVRVGRDRKRANNKHGERAFNRARACVCLSRHQKTDQKSVLDPQTLRLRKVNDEMKLDRTSPFLLPRDSARTAKISEALSIHSRRRYRSTISHVCQSTARLVCVYRIPRTLRSPLLPRAWHL